MLLSVITHFKILIGHTFYFGISPAVFYIARNVYTFILFPLPYRFPTYSEVEVQYLSVNSSCYCYHLIYSYIMLLYLVAIVKLLTVKSHIVGRTYTIPAQMKYNFVTGYAFDLCIKFHWIVIIERD